MESQLQAIGFDELLKRMVASDVVRRRRGTKLGLPDVVRGRRGTKLGAGTRFAERASFIRGYDHGEMSSFRSIRASSKWPVHKENPV
jgi:hypothetical protein